MIHKFQCYILGRATTVIDKIINSGYYLDEEILVRFKIDPCSNTSSYKILNCRILSYCRCTQSVHIFNGRKRNPGS